MSDEDEQDAMSSYFAYDSREVTGQDRSLSPASLKGPLICHELGTGSCLVAGRVLMVADDRVVGQSESLGWAGLLRRGLWRWR